MKHLPYPAIGADGEILADEGWWQQMQLSKRAWQERLQAIDGEPDEGAE